MNPQTDSPVALITGAARRIGACIAETLHRDGYNLILHYRGSASEANALAKKLNAVRTNSVATLQADLTDISSVQQLADASKNQWQRLDLLVNNASSFYPTPLREANLEQWDNLIGSNLKGPFFLCQALAEPLREHRGCIINIADIHGDQPLAEHSIYCIAKAGNRMMTKTLAKELAPDVRVNGIAPGAIMWPENAAELTEQQKQKILAKVPLNRPGSPEDIAQAVRFLARSASYITGQVISVDGGRSC
ncbi:pteridine reductase [Porticoccaceae bacterium LTM1]|nr:pteridine reductase [Porticoccaceae bacterium LTM1]